MTCGAAGGLNSLFRAVLEPGEDVVCPAPYFVEYGFYASNHQAELRPVPCLPHDFRLDLAALEEAITEKTRIVLINSPNNPTGRVYSREELQELVQILERKRAKHKRPIFLVSDEPYRFLTYDGVEVAPILPMYEHSIVVSSFSKNLSMAGERIGYVLVNPDMAEKKELLDGLVFTNRILGFVNAPAIGQQLLNHTLNSSVDVSVYQKRRALMQDVLDQAGYTYAAPMGGFYFFPQAPGGDDLSFVQKLQEERVLAVPGTGFGFPGYFRLTFCVPEKVIENSRQSMAAALKNAYPFR
jgi:aspartate aminotransferase